MKKGGKGREREVEGTKEGSKDVGGSRRGGKETGRKGGYEKKRGEKEGRKVENGQRTRRMRNRRKEEGRRKEERKGMGGKGREGKEWGRGWREKEDREGRKGGKVRLAWQKNLPKKFDQILKLGVLYTSVHRSVQNLACDSVPTHGVLFIDFACIKSCILSPLRRKTAAVNRGI